MKQIARYVFVITFLWLGFVLAISFMEAPVKFTAPSLDLVTGLDVGRQVFGALNKIELLFAILGAAFLAAGSPSRRSLILFAGVVAILLLQTLWLLPALDARVQIYLDGQTPEASSLHWMYIAIEVIKALGLLFLGFSEIRDWRTSLESR